MSPRQKNALHGNSVNSEGIEVIYRGHITLEHVSFCFIKCTELNDSIFAHADRFDNLPSEGIKVNVDVTFKLSFTMKGPTAYAINIIF
ncbi:hypothetical protein D3C84_772980 [compost metagenome]